MTWEKCGALGGTRTPNLLIRSQMLLSLIHIFLARGQEAAHVLLLLVGIERRAP